MSTIQSFKRINQEDFEEKDRALADSIGGSVNVFAQEVIDAFNKNISVDDNLKMEYKDLDVSVDASGVPTQKLQFKTSITGKIRGIVVIKVDNLTTPTSYATSTPFVSFSQKDTLLTVNNITSLLINNKYRLTLLSMG